MASKETKFVELTTPRRVQLSGETKGYEAGSVFDVAGNPDLAGILLACGGVPSGGPTKLKPQGKAPAKKAAKSVAE